MIKKWSFYAGLAVVVAFLSFSFKSFDLDVNQWSLTDETHYLFPSEKQNDYNTLSIPFTGRFFIGFKEAIGLRESQGKYRKINSLGYMGKYQFGIETLRTIGVHDSNRFLNSPRLQEKAFVALLSKNKSLLRDIIKKYDGKVIAGVYVTESGILAAAHLGGAGSVKKFFRYKGKRNFTDAYGTSLSSYMKDFGGYETSGIVADNNARVN